MQYKYVLYQTNFASFDKPTEIGIYSSRQYAKAKAKQLGIIDYNIYQVEKPVSKLTLRNGHVVNGGYYCNKHNLKNCLTCLA